MAKLRVEIVVIDDIEEHPDADRLEIAKVKGWDVVVQKDSLKKGDWVIYAPIDSMIPEKLSDKLGVTKYLSKGRVRTARLRGVYSQGLIFSVDHLPGGYYYELGENVAGVLGITKFVPPPPPVHMQGEQRRKHPDFYEYTEIENIKNYPDILIENEEVIITEKLHGTNFRCGMFKDDMRVGSHHTDLREKDTNIYWIIARKFELDKVIPDDTILYGEIYGPGVQKLAYDVKDVTVAFFDMKQGGQYMSFEFFKKFCEDNKLPMVPVLFEGKWTKGLMELAEGQSTLAKHIREGIVIKPKNERYDRTIRRVILKHINEKYLLKDYGDLK